MFCLPLFGPLHNGRVKNGPMHFWIDKGSDPCGYNGFQRVPASLSAQGRRRRASKPMATPVHRFPQIQPRSPPHSRAVPTNLAPTSHPSSHIAPSISYGASRASPESIEPSLYLDNGVADVEMSLSPRPKPSRIKYYLLAMLCIVVVTVTALKYYYNMQSQGIVDISIESSLSLLAAGLMVSCMLSGCRSKSADPHFPTSSTLQHSGLVGTDIEVPPTTTRRDEVILELHPTASTSLPSSAAAAAGPPPSVASCAATAAEPPPPYHLAILLPAQEGEGEVPPPTYDKAVVR